MRKTRQQMGQYRHDLLVAMRVVNKIEQEMINAEWEHWVTEEANNCDRASNLLLDRIQAKNVSAKRSATVNATEDAQENLQKYCSSCKVARQHLLAL